MWRYAYFRNTFSLAPRADERRNPLDRAGLRAAVRRIADQAILNNLRSFFPHAKIGHAFATTEAGVVFAVNDGLMGFPASALEHTPHVEIKIENRSLHVRSHRTAQGYLVYRDAAAHCEPLADAVGFVDTRDVVELRDGRYHFIGRGDGMINVGGMKVYPEEVEAVINGHPKVQISLVSTKRIPLRVRWSSPMWSSRAPTSRWRRYSFAASRYSSILP